MRLTELINEDWNKVNHHDHTNGLSQKAVNAYRHEHPGSKLKTAVTTKPSKLKAGSKAAKRRKSFCARMSGNKGPMKKPNGKPTPKALALRRWHCESLFELFVTAKKGIYEAEGEASGLKHLTPHLARDILDQIEKEGVHAIVKSIEWGDGGAKELMAMIKHDLEKVANRVEEGWSQKYKSSINCSHPKGFSQRAHCQGKNKHNEDVATEHVCPDCGMCQAHGDSTLDEIAKGAKDSNGVSHCWTGYHAAGTKKGKNGGQVRNCVPNESIAEAGMPSSVVKSKQRYATMTDQEFHQAHKDKSEDDLKAMAWRHGYGKGSTHYVDKHKKGQQGVAEEVNPDIISDEYFIDPTENVRMGDFVFNARTFSGSYRHQNDRGLQIRAYNPTDLKRSIGSADFIVKSDKKGNTWLESDDTEVDELYRSKGVASMMYVFAKSLGNDIRRSPYQSKAGSNMWNKWGKDAQHLVGEQGVAQGGQQAAIAIAKRESGKYTKDGKRKQ